MVSLSQHIQIIVINQVRKTRKPELVKLIRRGELVISSISLICAIALFLSFWRDGLSPISSTARSSSGFASVNRACCQRILARSLTAFLTLGYVKYLHPL